MTQPPALRMTVDRNFKVWDSVYASFEEAPSAGPGFDGPVAQQRALQAGREAAARMASGQPLDYSLRQRNALLPAVVAMVLADQGKASVLDFGGGLGTGYMVLAKALGGPKDRVDYRVVEVEGICRLGGELFAGKKGPKFEPSLPAHGPFDLVFTASTLQYIADWRSVVARLASYGSPNLVFADAFVGPFASYVTLQNYYDSRIRHWFLNFETFVSEVEEHGYSLALRSECDARILDAYGPLPMDNFPEELRLAHTSNLLFCRTIGGCEAGRAP
jgi:putative methyltransferase (TIGR04325 family)